MQGASQEAIIEVFGAHVWRYGEGRAFAQKFWS
jgi:hypothetical protein